MKQPLVWIDLEMTGLDPDRDVIVEIAAIVTDGRLTEVVEGPDIVLGATEVALETMAPVVQEMHTASGLLDEIRASEVTVVEAEREVLDFVRAHVPKAGVAVLAGNSIHADRAFLRRYMPTLLEHLHYRLVDVSTVKELARRWHPQVLAAAPEKVGGHRALADIRESIAELRAYRETFFVLADAPDQ